MQKENRYDSLFQYYATKYGLCWKWLKAQAMQESSLDPYAVSNRGAKGLMQFMPMTWADFGSDDPFNPENSIEAACKYMRWLIDCFGEIPDQEEKIKMALGSYNGGKTYINEMLSLARESIGQPKSHGEWKSQGEAPGVWQLWDYASEFLGKVDRVDEKQVLDYVEKIEKYREAL